MAKDTTYTGTLGELRRLIQPLQANSGELTHLEVPRVNLEGLIVRAEELTKEQSAFAASKQETTRKLQEVIVEGRRLATLLRQALRQHYGIRSEKLSEFGLQPFRGRKRTEKPLPPPEDAGGNGKATPSPSSDQPEN